MDLVRKNADQKVRMGTRRGRMGTRRGRLGTRRQEVRTRSNCSPTRSPCNFTDHQFSKYSPLVKYMLFFITYCVYKLHVAWFASVRLFELDLMKYTFRFSDAKN